MNNNNKKLWKGPQHGEFYFLQEPRPLQKIKVSHTLKGMIYGAIGNDINRF